MFLRKKRDKEEINEPEEKSCALSYPIGRAAKMLGISKKTLLRHAEAMDLSFEWDGRGRRVKADDIQKLLGNKTGEISRKEKPLGASEIPSFSEPTEIRVWQRWAGGIVEKRGDFLCNSLEGCIEAIIKGKLGPGKYTIRRIENGCLSGESRQIKIAGVPHHQPRGELRDKWVANPHRFQ